MALTANSENPIHEVEGELLTYRCGASVVIYKNSFVGIDPAGYAKAFSPGDRFIGIAYEEVTAATATTTAGTANIRVYHKGCFVYTSASAIVLQSDVNRPVFAGDDDALALSGHPDAYVGRITYVEGTCDFKVKIRTPGERPEVGTDDTMCIDINLNAGTSPVIAATTAGTGAFWFGNKALVSVVGATNPTIGIVTAAGECVHTYNAANEVETVAIETARCFNIGRGITAEFIIRNGVAGGAGSTLFWGLLGGLDITAAMRANPMVGTALQKHAMFEITSNALDINATSDDNVTAVGLTDTTLNNILAGPDKYCKVIVRPSGVCEFWGGPVIAGTNRPGYPGAIVRVLGGLPLVGVATAFTVGAATAVDACHMAGYIGICKSAAAEASVATLNWKRARFAGCAW